MEENGPPGADGGLATSSELDKARGGRMMPEGEDRATKSSGIGWRTF